MLQLNPNVLILINAKQSVLQIKVNVLQFEKQIC